MHDGTHLQCATAGVAASAQALLVCNLVSAVLEQRQGMQVVRCHKGGVEPLLEQLGRHLVAAPGLTAVLPHLLLLRLLVDNHSATLADHVPAVKVRPCFP